MPETAPSQQAQANTVSKRRIGRPPRPIPQQKADEIIDWISQGKTLRDFCRIEGNPVYSVVYEWMEKDELFAARFARARDIGHEVIAQECLAIADDAQNDWMNSRHGSRVNKECVERSKLRVDTRLKLLARWNPAKWGDAVRLNHSGTVSLEALVSGRIAEQQKELSSGEDDKTIDAVSE